MLNIVTDELKVNSIYNSDLTLDGKIIILPHGVNITQSFIDMLAEWQIKHVVYDENAKFETLPPPSSLQGETKEIDVHEFLDNSTSASENLPKIDDPISKQPQKVQPAPNTLDNDDIMMETARVRYQEFIKYIHYVYTHYATHKTIDSHEISEQSRSLASFVRDNRKFVLRLVGNPHNRVKNFLVVHAMRSTVFAIIIALEMHMDINKIRDLAESCILHEIGMLRLPPQLYIVNRKLLPLERNYMTAHTVYGYNILKMQGFPQEIILAVLEHHENENGLGYPRRLPSKQITVFAKIIHVACSFEAITAPRTYKEERSTYDAMKELMFNQNNQYDAVVLKALLYSLSMYPVGSFVFLSSGKVAEVIDVNPQNPRNPIVRLLTDNAENQTIQTGTAPTNKIVRVLTKKEEKDVIKALGPNNKWKDRNVFTKKPDENGYEVIDPEAFE